MTILKETVKLKVSDMAVFDQRLQIVSCERMYFAYFGKIPNMVTLLDIDYNTAVKWIDSNLSNLIIKKHILLNTYLGFKEHNYSQYNYILKNEILLEAKQGNGVVVLFSNETIDNAMALVDELKKIKLYKMFRYKSKISLLIENNGLKLVDLKNKKPSLSMELNYNDDLNGLHNRIIRDLKKKNNSGLFLFHGTPGTGKSTYLRYLMHYTNKRVIFLPPKIAGNLDSPNLVNILVEEPNSILVIEDAENLLTSREKGNESTISMLLTNNFIG